MDAELRAPVQRAVFRAEGLAAGWVGGRLAGWLQRWLAGCSAVAVAACEPSMASHGALANVAALLWLAAAASLLVHGSASPPESEIKMAVGRLLQNMTLEEKARQLV